MNRFLAYIVMTVGLLSIMKSGVVYSAECASKWLFYKEPSEVYGPYGYCDTKAIESSPNNYWCATQTIPVYYAQKQFGTDWTEDCFECVSGLWYYAHKNGISGPYFGCTTDGADFDANGNPIPWCPTIIANTYVTQHGFETNWEGCDSNPCSKIQCGENQYCDSHLAACVTKTQIANKNNQENCITQDSPTNVGGGMLAYTLAPCDRAVYSAEYGNIAITMKQVNPVQEGMVLKIQENIQGKKTQRSVALATSFSNQLSNINNRFLNLHGLYLSIAPASFNPNYISAYLYVSETCSEFIEACKNSTGEEEYKKWCTGICDPSVPETAKTRSVAFIPQDKVSVSAPKGYGLMANWYRGIAACSRKKMETLFGVQSNKPSTLAFHINDEPINNYTIWASANFGGIAENVPCTLHPLLSDAIIASQANAQVNAVAKKLALLHEKAVNENECVDDLNLTQGLSHEMAHQFAIDNFIVLNSEGLASFAQAEAATQTTNSVKTSLICGEKGYSFGQDPSAKVYPYTSWATDNYFTGACFWREVRNTYGPEIFKKIFQYANTLKIGNYKMLADIIHPIVKDDFFSKIKDKYMFKEDPIVYQSQQNYFTDD